MATKRHPAGTCIVCDLSRLDEKKPPDERCVKCFRPLADDDDGPLLCVVCLGTHIDGTMEP